MYIGRGEAVNTINKIINSGIISEELEQEMEQIATCINAEDDGLFLWGAEDDGDDLFVSLREDLVNIDWVSHCNEVFEKYRIK